MLSTCFVLLWLWCTSIIISSVGCAIYHLQHRESSTGRFINVRAVWETTVNMSNTLIRTKSVEYMYAPLFRFNRWLNHLVNNIECYIATAHTHTHTQYCNWIGFKKAFSIHWFFAICLFGCAGLGLFIHTKQHASSPRSIVFIKGKRMPFCAIAHCVICKCLYCPILCSNKMQTVRFNCDFVNQITLNGGGAGEKKKLIHRNCTIQPIFSGCP